MKIGLLWGAVNSEDRIDDIGGELLSESIVELGGEGGAGNGQEEFSVNRALKLELVEELDFLYVSTK